jgi:hypothetical protein
MWYMLVTVECGRGQVESELTHRHTKHVKGITQLYCKGQKKGRVYPRTGHEGPEGK